MKAQTKRSLMQMGGTVLGAVAGGPIGAKLGAGLGTLAGGLVPEDELVSRTKTVYPELSHAANYTRSPLPQPQHFTYYHDLEPSKFDNLMSFAAPTVSGMAPSLMGNNFKGVLPLGQLKANTGMYTANAPAHEQGGLDIEVEGGELILNAEQQAYIDAGISLEERARRYQMVRETLINKSTNQPLVARDGLYTFNRIDPLPALIDIERMHEFHPRQQIPNIGDVNINIPTGLVNEGVFAEQLLRNTAGRSMKAHRNLMARTYRPNEGLGLNTDFQSNLTLYGEPASVQTEQQKSDIERRIAEQNKELLFIDDAIRAQQDTNRLGIGSDIGKMLISAGGLMNTMPVTEPFTAGRIVAPEYVSQDEQMTADLNQLMAVNNAILKDLSPEHRVAGLSNIMQQYQAGLRDISKHRTEVANLNAAARAEAANQNIAMGLQLDQMNYEKRLAENQAEHMRKQIGINEFMKSLDTMITRGGQAKTNVAGLEMLRSMWPTLDDELKAEFASIFNINL